MRKHLRNLSARTLLMGAIITLIVALLDFSHRLEFVERWFYDQRAKRCQYFTPPPNDLLVHLDIDDASLETIGRWPWPRTALGEIIDELRLAGAKAVALDVLFPEPQPPTALVQPDGKTQVIDHDANFSAALSRFGKVLVPISFSFEYGPSVNDRERALIGLLSSDLELTVESARAKLGGAVTENEFLAARRSAMSQRVRKALAEKETTLEQVRASLLPRSAGEMGTSSTVRELERQYAFARSLNQIERFSIANRNGDPAFPVASDITMAIPALARPASYCGYVNYINKPDDPIIRGVPLWVTYEGRRYPQMDLALVCAMKGIDINAVRLGENEMVLPEPNGNSTRIPVRQVLTRAGTAVNGYFDMPWFGSTNWETMYDYPAYREPKRHIPMTLPYALADARKILLRNNAQAKKAMEIFADAGLDSAKKFQKSPPPAEDIDATTRGISAVIREASELGGPALKSPPAELSADEKVIVDAIRALERIAADNQAFAEKAKQLRAAVGGKAVIIGWAATSTIDQYPTPLHSGCPGVVIHGVAFNAMMTGHFWYKAPDWVNALLTIVLGLVTTLIVVRMSPFGAFCGTFVLLIIYLLTNGLLIFDYGNWIVGMAGPVVVMLSVWGMLTLVRLVSEARERARITRRFQSYVDPAIVQYVIAHPELARLEGQVRQMTVCFTDLAGFTTFTETLREKAVSVLGRYIKRMTPVIRRNRGLIHRFMGDGIMFSYGAPIENANQAADAVKTIIEMGEALETLNSELIEEGLPRLRMRAGVFSGPAVVGDSGAEDAAEYACLGDTTNTAARLEGANKNFGTGALISEATAKQLDGQFLVRPIGRLILVGKREAVMAYEPIAPLADATEDQKELARLTERMFEEFVAGRFDECRAAIDELEKRFGRTKLTELYRQHAESYAQAAPDGFNGEIRLTEK